MAKRKWKAGQSEEAEPPSFLQRFHKPIILAVIAVAAIGFFVYRFNNSKYRYGDARSDYNRALAECMHDRTRADSGADAVEEAADACMRDVPAPPTAEKK